MDGILHADCPPTDGLLVSTDDDGLTVPWDNTRELDGILIRPHPVELAEGGRRRVVLVIHDVRVDRAALTFPAELAEEAEAALRALHIRYATP